MLAVSCRGSSSGEKETADNNKIEEVFDITQRALLSADSLFTQMTLEERVGQCLMPSIYSTDDAYTLSVFHKYIEDFHIGGIVLMQGDLKSAKTLAEIGDDAVIPLFVAIDAEWGLGMRLKDAPIYPKNGDISKEAAETELYDYGRKIAEECRQAGINMVLGPVIDINSGYGGVIGNRSFGSDPEVVSEFGVAYAKGLESGGVVSVAKHFPGHGSTIMDSHLGVARINRDISALDTLDLKPFQEYIGAGLTGIMAGHIQALALDPDGKAASVSMDMLTSLLREEMGFKGLILTDAFDMGGAKGFSSAEALRAGADLILCPKNVGKEYQNLLKMVKSGELSLDIINDRCRRILFVKFLFLSFP